MRQPLRITYRNVEPSPVIDTLVRDWADKLDAIYARITHCSVTLEAPNLHHRNGRHFRVRVEVTIPGGELVVGRDPPAGSTNEDLYRATMEAFRAMRRRLRHVILRRRGATRRPGAAPPQQPNACPPPPPPTQQAERGVTGGRAG
jgi:ribosome-associated translation inhibitor RaiA